MFSLAGLVAASRLQRGTPSSSAAFMYVGSFTSPDRGHGYGIPLFCRRGDTAAWAQAQVLKDLENPSFLIVDRRQQFLYAVHSDGDRASAYRIDQATGRLTLINHQGTGGSNGVHLA